MGRTVSELDATMTLNEFRDWKEYFRYESPYTQEIQMAMLLAFKAYSKDNPVSYLDFMISKAEISDVKEQEPLSGEALDDYIKALYG